MAARERSTEPITAAADGSALGNPGPAGWAWYVDETTWHAGGWPHGTNNMGELQAVLDLLRATAEEPERELHILCDSQYVINCITRWMPGWKKKGWKKKDGKPVLNRDILEQLDAALAGRRYDFEWVKGHAGHPLNEAADERARAAATAFRDGRAPEEGPGFGAGSGAGAASAAEREPEPAPEPDPSPQPDPSRKPEPSPEPEPAVPGHRASADVERPRDGERLPDVDRLPGLEARLAEAEVYTDAGRLARLVAPELTWVTWRGRLADRATALRYPERAFALDGASEVVRVERVGERAGVVVSRIETRRGQALRTSLWRAEEDGWVLAHRQDTPTA